MTFVRTLLTAALAGCLTACAVSTPLEVRSTGDGLSQQSSVAFVGSQDEPSEQRKAFAAALTQALSQRSLSVAPSGRYIAEYAFSISDATEGLVAGKPDKAAADAGAEPDWAARPRKKRTFDKCKAKRMRGTLVLLDRSTGKTAYRGEGGQIECSFANEDIAALADALVADALSLSGR